MIYEGYLTLFMSCTMFLFFFFSSRRRHTRLVSDWSSDVCSSDLVLFSAASLACGLASSTGVLVAARAAQGFGAAIVSPSTLSIITTTFEEGSERNKALGIWGAMGGSGAAAGVLFGGILTKYAGWE